MLQEYLVWEGIEGGANGVTATELGGFEAPNDVLQGGGHHKVLLLQSQLFTFEELRRGKQNQVGSSQGRWAIGAQLTPPHPSARSSLDLLTVTIRKL